MCERNPALYHISDINCKSMFQFAVECRQENIYNLLYEKLDDSERHLLITSVDNFYNSMLHAAASISPFAQLDRIQGPALQMQRELQWFKVSIYNYIDTCIWIFPSSIPLYNVSNMIWVNVLKYMIEKRVMSPLK